MQIFFRYAERAAKMSQFLIFFICSITSIVYLMTSTRAMEMKAYYRTKLFQPKRRNPDDPTEGSTEKNQHQTHYRQILAFFVVFSKINEGATFLNYLFAAPYPTTSPKPVPELYPIEKLGLKCEECPNVYLPVCTSINVTFQNYCQFQCRKFPRSITVVRVGFCIDF